MVMLHTTFNKNSKISISGYVLENSYQGFLKDRKSTITCLWFACWRRQKPIQTSWAHSQSQKGFIESDFKLLIDLVWKILPQGQSSHFGCISYCSRGSRLLWLGHYSQPMVNTLKNNVIRKASWAGMASKSWHKPPRKFVAKMKSLLILSLAKSVNL